MRTLLPLAMAPLAVIAGHALPVLVQDLSLAAGALALGGALLTLVVTLSGPEDDGATA